MKHTTRRRRRQPRHHGRVNNHRPAYRKPLPWPEQFNLKDRLGFDAFLCYMIEQFWRQNPLDPRALSAMNGTLRLLCESRGWIQRTPLQIIQATIVQPSKIDFKKIIEETPLEERPIIVKFLARAESRLSTS